MTTIGIAIAILIGVINLIRTWGHHDLINEHDLRIVDTNVNFRKENEKFHSATINELQKLEESQRKLLQAVESLSESQSALSINDDEFKQALSDLLQESDERMARLERDLNMREKNKNLKQNKPQATSNLASLVFNILKPNK